MQRERQLEFVLMYFKFSRSLKSLVRDSSSAVQCLIIAIGLYLLLFQGQAPLGLAYCVLGCLCTTVQNCWPLEEPSASVSHSSAIVAPVYSARIEFQCLGMLLTSHCSHSVTLHLAGFCGKSQLFLVWAVNAHSITLAGAQCEMLHGSTVGLSSTKHLESCVLIYIRGFGNGCLLFPEHFQVMVC